MEYVYRAQGVKADEELAAILSEKKEASSHEAPSIAKNDGPALERVQRSPLDEVKQIIAEKAKPADAVLSEYRVKQKLEKHKTSGAQVLATFLGEE